MNRKLKGIIQEVINELDRATQKHPTWPSDPLHAFAVVAEEAGELQKDLLQLTYEGGKSTPQEAREEAVQLGAMALRFLLSFEAYTFSPCPHHHQATASRK